MSVCSHFPFMHIKMKSLFTFTMGTFSSCSSSSKYNNDSSGIVTIDCLFRLYQHVKQLMRPPMKTNTRNLFHLSPEQEAHFLWCSHRLTLGWVRTKEALVEHFKHIWMMFQTKLSLIEMSKGYWRAERLNCLNPAIKVIGLTRKHPREAVSWRAGLQASCVHLKKTV